MVNNSKYSFYFVQIIVIIYTRCYDDRKNKMINEELYDLADSQLVNERNIAKDLCFEFNNTKPSETQKQKEVLIITLINPCKVIAKNVKI